jgi:hypothetical protein
MAICLPEEDEVSIFVFGNILYGDENQLYKVSTETNECEQLEEMPYKRDVYNHQYFLRPRFGGQEGDMYLLGGRHVHQINLYLQNWKTVLEGSNELISNPPVDRPGSR